MKGNKNVYVHENSLLTFSPDHLRRGEMGEIIDVN